MKKTSKWMLVPALLMLFAGIIMTSCPSDPEKGKELEEDEVDFILLGGKFNFPFETPRIIEGRVYEVTLTIDDCDLSFLGSRPGGKLTFTRGGTGELLSGWLNSTPPVVASATKQYKWEFKAGEKNSDSLDVAVPATTPEGAPQFFELTAQTNGWADYPASVSFGIKGSFSIKELVTITSWESKGTVTLGNDGTAGKGALTESDMERIRTLVEEDPRSIIRVTVSVVVGSNGADPGNGVVGVGGWESNNSMSITVPADAQTGPLEFTADLTLDDLLKLQPAGFQIAINPYNGATVTKAELFKPVYEN